MCADGEVEPDGAAGVALNEDLNKLRDAHKAQDLAAIDAATNELNNAAQKMHAAAQQAGAGQPGAGAGAGFGGQQAGPQGGQQSGNQNDTIQDADFEEVK